MEVIEQSFEIMVMPIGALELIEKAGRTCYKSEAKITPDSSKKFVNGLKKSGHHSVIEHSFATVRFITDRAVTHELVRHRLCSFSQESQRYVNYGSDHIKFIKPVWAKNIKNKTYDLYPSTDFSLGTSEYIWINAMIDSELRYKELLQYWKPEQARTVLPNSTKTEIVVTANLREWMHIFKLRTSKAAYPQIRELMISCLKEFNKYVPVLFEDLIVD